MKVLTKQATATVIFKDISYGQVFVYNEDEVYMKLDSVYHSHDEYGSEEAIWTAVHLESGELCEFDSHCEVYLPHRVSPIEVTY